ncbi:MAG: CHAT domain-containing protein, partial [Alphaproteobacteria bacterium]|nr:CHAT domain-containing protein [Alphaproteobacteria bacterium]
VEGVKAIYPPAVAAPKAAYVIVSERLLAGDTAWIQAHVGEDFALKIADPVGNPAFAARLYVLNARLHLRLGHYDKALDDVSRALAVALHIDTQTNRYDIAVSLTELIEILAECHDSVRALRWLDITGRFIEATLSQDEFEFARFLYVKQSLASHFADPTVYERAVADGRARVARLQIPADQRDYWLADDGSAAAAIAAVNGPFDEAREALRTHPFADRKSEILSRGAFANNEELLYALVDTFVEVLANHTPDQRWTPLFAREPAWPTGVPEAAMIAAYRKFGIGFLDLAVDKARARGMITDAAKAWLDAFEQSYGASTATFPLPNFVDRIAFGLMLALQARNQAVDGDLLIRAVELLNRNPRYALSDALAGLSSQTTEEGRRLIHSALRLADQQSEWEVRKLQDLVARIAAHGPFDAHDVGPLSAMADFIRTRERLAAAVAATPGATGARARLPSLAELQAALGEDEALVSYSAGAFGGIKICVRRTSLESVPIVVEPSQLRVDVKLLTAALTATFAPSDVNDSQYPVASAVRLYHLYFDGLAGCMAGVRHLIFVPPADMAGVPLAALLEEAPPRSAAGFDLGAAKWLFLDFDISYVTSVQNFLSARRLAARPPGDRMLLGLGDPRLRAVNVPALADLRDLPETAFELTAIGKLLAGDRVDIRLGRNATEAAFRAMPLADYQIIQFATHGLIRGDVPGLAQAALVLTPVNSEDRRNDGLLTATEIADLNLRARLVVLSACNTANVDLSLLASQVQGLTTAFAVSGVPTTIAALWPVESATSERLMIAFYTHLRTGSSTVAAALRGAMADVLHGARSPAYRHPRFWAPFIALGDGGTKIER